MRISYSDLDTYRFCPRKFKFRRDKAPYNDSADLPLHFGSAMHSALKAAYSNTLVPLPLEKILEVYAASWPEKVKIKDDPWAQETYLRGVAVLKDYLEHNNPRRARVVGLEKPVRLNFSGHTIMGRLDRVDMLADNYFEVLDYKTSGKLPVAINLADNWQLAIYQQAVSEMFQVPRVRTSLVYVMFGGHKLSHEFQADELTKIKYDITDLIGQIASDETYEPRPGPYCQRCGYAAICPAMRHQRLRLVLPGGGREEKKEEEKDMLAPLAQQEVQVVIDEFIALRQQIQKLQEQAESCREVLMAYMTKENLTRLFSDLGEVAWAMSQVTSYDAAAVAKILQDTHYWQEVITVSTNKLKTVLPQLTAEQRQAIKAAATITKKSQLRVKTKLREVKLVQ